MESQDFLALIEQRLGALEARLETIADRQLTAEVKRTIAIARVDLPFALAKARYVLELLVRDIYRRERPDSKPKPLFNMIEDLCAEKGLFGAKIATDINYIRINGNLIVHAQDEAVAVTDRQVEVIVLMTINLVEWYLTDYLPARPGARAETIPDLPPPPNPYRGLLAFREEDATNYFGRETDAADLLAAVARQPLVAVVGASGSGKSSLVQAGLVPALRTAGGWAVATFRPRGRPFAELAQALVGTWPLTPVERLAQADALAGLWSAGKVPLIDAIHETLRQTDARRLLLVADQFEEVWTLAAAPGQAPGFLDLLVGAVEAAALPAGQPPALCLLPTLRADFLGHALDHEGLAASLDRHPKKLLGPVADAERLSAIVHEPARQAGVQLEDLLVERILRDLAQIAGEAPGDASPGAHSPGGGASLPLLEFTLEQLWERQRERRLTHLGYEELGGLQRALARHADAVYTAFTEAERERVRHVLVQMVRPGEGTADTRQVATRAQVHPENWPLVARLADARLVVTSHDPARDEDTAELIHEAMIQHWPPLRDWLREDRAFRLWQNGLRQAQAEWERTGRDAGALLAGARLAEAEERLATQGERLGEDETGYIRASLEHRAAEVAERERFQRRIGIGLALFLIVALGLASVAGWEWRIADHHKNDAKQQALKAEQRAAVLSGNVARSLTAEGLLDQALLLILDSLRVFDESSVPDDILIALTKTLEKKSRIETRVLFPNMQVFDTGDALLLVNPATNDIWRLADSLDPSLLVRGTPNDDKIEKIALPSRSDEYLVLRKNGDIEGINVRSGERRTITLPPPPDGNDSRETQTSFLPDGLIVREFSYGHPKQVYDTADGRAFTIDNDYEILGKAPGGALYEVTYRDPSIYTVRIGKAGTEVKKTKLNTIDTVAIGYGLRDCVAKMPAAARTAAFEGVEYSRNQQNVTCTNFGDSTLITELGWGASGGSAQTETLYNAKGESINIRQLFSSAFGRLSDAIISWVGYSKAQNRIAILLNRTVYTIELYDYYFGPPGPNPPEILLNYQYPRDPHFARFVGDKLVVVDGQAGRLDAHDLSQDPKPLFSNPEAAIIGSKEPIPTLHHGNCMGYSTPLTNQALLAGDIAITFDTAASDEHSTGDMNSAEEKHELRVLIGGKEIIVPLDDESAYRCVQFSADWKRLAVVSDSGVRLHDFDHILKTGNIQESEIGFIEERDIRSAIFLGPTGDGIVTSDAFLWTPTASEKSWTSSEIYRSDNRVIYAEPDLTGKRLIVLETIGTIVSGLVYSLSAHEKWFDLGEDYKWLGATFTDKSEIAVSSHQEWTSVFSIPSMRSFVNRALDALSPECRPPSPDAYRQSSCWPSAYR